MDRGILEQIIEAGGISTNHNISGQELPIKRFYLPIEVDRICPHCQKLTRLDFDCDYLSYPIVGQSEVAVFGCEHCEESFGVDVTINLSATVAGTTTKV